MYVDALTLAAVAGEWRDLLTGARIDTIIQPSEHAIALQVYAPGGEDRPGRNSWLYLSAHPQLARAHLTAFKPPKIASEPPPFVMLLRKHLEGARIETVTQPRWERVLEIVAGYRKSPESDERTRFRLIVEIMGRLSNIILVDEQGMILGSLKRVGADINRYRVIAANVAYVPPPPQQRSVAGQMLPRLEPTTVTASQLAISATEETGVAAAQTKRGKSGKAAKARQATLWQLLTHSLLGFSPLPAKEVVFRTTGDAESVLDKESVSDDTWEELAWNVRDLAVLYDSHAWLPRLVERAGGGKGKEAGAARVPLAFAPYVLEQYAELPGVQVRSLPSMNEALDEFYARAEWRDAMEGVRAPVRKVLQTQLERCKRKADLLQQEMTKSEEAARYRLHAELLLAHQYEVQQGQTNVSLPNFYAESDAQGEQLEVAIALDPRFDAVGNANRLFNKYHKLRRATALVPAQIEQNAAELATIEQLLADLMLAETPAEVALVKAEVQTAGYMRGARKNVGVSLMGTRKKAGKKGGKQGKGKPTPPGGGVPLHVQSRDGFTLLVGKNSRQNEEVTFHQASANDLWLHARGVPGAHVIVKAAGREVPRQTIEQAASLAAYYSQARGSTSVPVDYTLQRHVRHMKGGGPGMVIYERERTIYVEPET